MTTKEVMKRIRRAERNRTGVNCTRWYSSVHPKRNGEAEVRTWDVKTYRGKPLILLASVYPTDGSTPKVSGRCLTSMWDNCPHWSWMDYGGKGHVAVWEDVDACRNEMLDPRWAHKFGRGIEFYGLGHFVNGFEGTRYQYGCFRDSGLRVSDWLDCMHISPQSEIVIKAGLNRWLDPRYLPTLVDNKGLCAYLRANAERMRRISPYYILREYAKTGGKVNDERGRAYSVCEKYGFASLPFSPLRIVRWFDRTKVAPSKLRHHIDNLRELGMDLDYEPHVLPKDFATYSLAVEERVREKREMERLAKEAAALEKERTAREARIYARRQIRKWLAEGRIGPRFAIVIPNTETEFHAEGHAMHNCVGTYFGKWKAGNAEVAFIRKDGKPYIDMEIRDEGIYQARYKHNKAVDETSADYKLCEIALAAFKRRAA